MNINKKKVDNKSRKPKIFIAVIVCALLFICVSSISGANKQNSRVEKFQKTAATQSDTTKEANSNEPKAVDLKSQDKSANSSSQPIPDKEVKSIEQSKINESSIKLTESKTNTSSGNTSEVDAPKPNISQSESDKNKSYTVYVTKTGTKYHSKGCQCLKKSQIAMDKDEAIAKGYTPCGICNP